MQLICEAYNILKNGLGLSADEMHQVFADWNKGELDSFLVEITRDILAFKDTDGGPLVDKILGDDGVITLEPLRKFPLVRDLTVDRQRMFEALKKVKAWVPVDGTHNLGPGPRQSQADHQVMYTLSTCMTCACCLEACPQVTVDNNFIGAAAISQARLFNMHPTGKLNAEERVRGLMGEGGIQDCGKAQNCVEVCPKEIPLTTSIAQMNRAVTKQVVKDLFFDEDASEGASGPG
jgi:succinate dehydrogenase / fumarate reductase iron-sulfur subunit